jgi:hypothetical protein
MQNFLHPDKIDLLRETLIVLIGIIARWMELRKLKKKEHD